MLDSKAVASIVERKPGVFTLYVRGDYQENLGFYAFTQYRVDFNTLSDALKAYRKTYPLGNLVPFEDLTTAEQ